MKTHIKHFNLARTRLSDPFRKAIFRVLKETRFEMKEKMASMGEKERFWE